MSASHSYEHRTPKDLPPGDGDGDMVSFIIGTLRHRLAGAEAAARVASGKPLNDDPSSPRVLRPGFETPGWAYSAANFRLAITF